MFGLSERLSERLIQKVKSPNDYPNDRLAVAQGTLLWQPVKFRGYGHQSDSRTSARKSSW